MELLSIAALLLGFLALLLGAGVWIAVALMATGWAGMQFAGGGIPAGSVLATTVWGSSASWSLAALPDLAYPDARGKRPADLDHAGCRKNH